MAPARRLSTASEMSSSAPDQQQQQQQQEMSALYDYLCKIILLGPSGSGKFVKSEWRVLSSQTIGVEFASKIVRVGTGANRKRVKLQLWDTAGTERFRSVSRSYYRGAAGAILVYDVSSIASFNALPTFLTDAKALASPHLAVVLAGNKVDLADTHDSAISRQSSLAVDSGGSTRSSTMSIIPGSRMTATKAEGREVAPDVASRWASRSGVPVTVEVSAFTGENVDEMFNRLARTILTKIELGEIDPDDPQSGIQYGDTGGFDEIEYGGSGGSREDGNTRRKRGFKVMGEWESVFRKPNGRGCC